MSYMTILFVFLTIVLVVHAETGVWRIPFFPIKRKNRRGKRGKRSLRDEEVV